MLSLVDILLAETAATERDGKRVIISVVLGSNPDPTRAGLEVRNTGNYRLINLLISI